MIDPTQGKYRNSILPFCGDTAIEDLDALANYISVAENWIRFSILASILEKIVESGYPPNELLLGIALFSEDWGCRAATADLESASSKLADFLDKKAQSDSGN